MRSPSAFRVGLLCCCALWLSLWVSDTAEGAGPVRALKVQVGQRSSIESMPRVRPDLVELVVRGAELELDSVLSVPAERGIRDIRVSHMGGSVWFIRIFLAEIDHDVDARVDEGVLYVDVVPRKVPHLTPRISAPSVSDVVAGRAPRSGVRGRPPPLSFLTGDAMAGGLDPLRYRPALAPSPTWLPRSTWDAVDRARSALLTAATPAAADQARYRLGMHYLELGLGREAHYYFSGLSPEGGSVSEVDLRMGAARAALATGRWTEAREGFRRAFELGGDEATVIEGLAVVSLATADPPRASTGRALAAVTGHPAGLVLAAELLQRDGYIAESRPLLELVGDRLSGDDAQRAALRLGDARFADGSLAEARMAWKQAELSIGDVRDQLADIVGGHPSTWAAAIPSLIAASVPRDDSGAEALFLLSQIDLLVGSREDAIIELASVIRRFPRKVERSDILERFWSIYSEHVQDLADREEWFDIAALHESVWDRSVRRAVNSPAVLVNVSRAYERVGLPERGAAVLRDALAVSIARGVRDPELVFHLAELYADLGAWREGMDTLKFLRQAKYAPEEMAGRLELLEARLALGGGDLAGAAAALGRATQDPLSAEAATLELALLDAEGGRCEVARAPLEALLLAPGGEDRFPLPRPWLALARCASARGDREVAAKAAAVAAGKTTSDAEQRYASWMAADAGGWKDPVAVDQLAKGDDVWSRFAQEQKDASAFADELTLMRAEPSYP